MSDSTDSATNSTCRSNGTQNSVLLRPEVDDILDVLCHRHRRLVLLLLQQSSQTTEADVVSRAAREDSAVQVTLRHSHLPKLAKAGYIEWDRESREISKGSHFDEVEPLLELISAHAGELPPDWP